MAMNINDNDCEILIGLVWFGFFVFNWSSQGFSGDTIRADLRTHKLISI